MESVNTKKIKSLLKKHGYRVVVSFSDNCPANISAVFPERKQKPFFPSFSVNFRYKFSGLAKGIYRKVDESEEIFLACSTYGITEIILASIYKVCGLVNYNDELICFYMNETEIEKDKFELSAFKFRLNKKQQEKKIELSNLVKEAVNGNFEKTFEEKAMQKDLLREYSIIKNIHTEEVGI